MYGPLGHGIGHLISWEAIFLTWDLRLSVIAVLGFFTAVYTLGWGRLRRSGHHGLATRWRLASYLGGQAVLAFALMSGIDLFQSSLFFVHMIQHELLMMVAPPLLWLASPLPISLWGLPRRLRLLIGQLLSPQTRFRRWLVKFTSAGTVWLVFVATTWLWHDPGAYQAALQNEFVHDLEHLTFFAAAMLFWWHVTGAAPRIHGRRSYGSRIGLILLTLVQNQILSIMITMSGDLIYGYYATAHRPAGLTAMDDQTIGGVIMWIPGGMMYLLAALVLLIRLLDREERKATRVGDARPVVSRKTSDSAALP